MPVEIGEKKDHLPRILVYQQMSLCVFMYSYKRRIIFDWIVGKDYTREEDLKDKHYSLFVCVEVLRPSQPSGVMSSAVSLPNHTFIGQA